MPIDLSIDSIVHQVVVVLVVVVVKGAKEQERANDDNGKIRIPIVYSPTLSSGKDDDDDKD
eukprot:jgi/Psemu1/48964/gm1.48964_g